MQLFYSSAARAELDEAFVYLEGEEPASAIGSSPM